MSPPRFSSPRLRRVRRRLFRPHRRRLSVPGAQVSPLRDTPDSSPARPAHRRRLAEEPPPGHAPAHKRPRVSRVPVAGDGGVAEATGDRRPTPPPKRRHAAISAHRAEAEGGVAMATEEVKYNKKNGRRGGSMDPRRLSDSLLAVRLQREQEEKEKEKEERLQPPFSGSTPRPRESHARLPQPAPPPARLPREEGPPPSAESPQSRGPETERCVKKTKKKRRRRSSSREQVKAGATQPQHSTAANTIQHWGGHNAT